MQLITTALLCAGLLGNVALHIIHAFTAPTYQGSLERYNHTEDAILYAKRARLPIAVTPGVAFPADILHPNPCIEPIDAVAVLKSFPAYKECEGLLVYAINDTADAQATARLAGGPVIIGDGLHYRVVR